MQKKHPILNRKKLVIAVSIAMLGGALSGCNENDPIGPDALGDWALKANGGAGGTVTSASGGRGGQLLMSNSGSTGGIDVLTRSKANTTFKTPLKPATTNLGSNPLDITADTTIQTVNYAVPVADGGLTTAGQLYVGTDDILRVAVGAAASYASDPVLAAGTPYLRFGEVGVYQAGDGVAVDDERFTGLSVAAGVTLSLSENSNGYNSDLGENVYGAVISFSEDIDNSGTITRATANMETDLALVARHYNASGTVTSAGVDAADGNPDGGNIGIFTSNGINNSGAINVSGFDDTDSDDAGHGGSVYLYSDGYVLNSGPVDASGGDAPGDGGDGGEVDISAAYSESTGDIDISGGNNTSDLPMLGDGGNGGNAYVYAGYIAINTANIDASGGDGDSGGDGGEAMVSNDAVGETKNAGDINLNGGSGSTGSGGDGGELDMFAYGGDALNSGNLTAVGGDSASSFGDAGDGGDFFFGNAFGHAQAVYPPGDVEVSGNLDVSGGNGVADDGTGYGGDGGEIMLSGGDGYGGMFITAPAPSSFEYGNSRVALLGYVSIDANGGDGASAGHAYNSGPSVAMTASASGSADTQSEDYQEGDTNGSIVNDVPINARGGNSIAADTEMGSGGNGGEISMYANYGPDPSSLDAEATNKADIDISGGNAVNDAVSTYSAGSGGGFQMFAAANADNSGAITSNGGAGGYSSGHGGSVYINGSGTASNSGALTANGGNGATSDNSGASGGSGGSFYVSAGTDATNSGAMAANGGTGSYHGGDGGIAAIAGATSVNKATVSVNGADATVIDPDDTFTAYGGDGGEIEVWASALDAATNTGTFSYLFGTGEEDGEEGSATVGIVCEGNCTP